MRVLNTTTGEFEEIDPKKRGTKYAILSHTWHPDGEQTYQELKDIQKRYARKRQPKTLRNVRNSKRRCLRSSTKAAGGIALSPGPSHELLSIAPTAQVSASTPETASNRDQPLSHIWSDSKLSPKIREACRVARENGYRYLWIDSCCIDKTSSSELSESINSMYEWYARAKVCYTFLLDVPAEEDHKDEDSSFRRSRWFGRGWTLQELIAPLDIVFLAQDWTVIGTKLTIGNLVADVTNIDYDALLHIEPLDEFSVAQRLSWAAKRETTREEDRAYSLLGIFGINMPTLYGEGRGAFRRLQEEIMRRTPDQSIFAWTYHLGLPDPSSDLHDPEKVGAYEHNDNRQISFRLSPTTIPLLAPSLSAFRECAGIEALSHNEVNHRLQLGLSTTDYDFTPYGIRLQLPVVPLSATNYFPPDCVAEQSQDIPLSQWYLAILGCGHRDFPGHLLGRIYCTQSSGSSIEYLRSGFIRRTGIDVRRWFGLLLVSPATITRIHSHISTKTLYIPQPEWAKGAKYLARRNPHETIKLVLRKKTREALSVQGYAATLCGPDDVHPTTHMVTLAHDTHTITIRYWHTLEEQEMGQLLTINAHVKMLAPNLQDTPSDLGVPHKAQVSWTDTWQGRSWHEELNVKDVNLAISEPGMALTVRLGLTFATRNCYLLRIQLHMLANLSSHSAPVSPLEHMMPGGWNGTP